MEARVPQPEMEIHTFVVAEPVLQEHLVKYVNLIKHLKLFEI